LCEFGRITLRASGRSQAQTNFRYEMDFFSFKRANATHLATTKQRRHAPLLGG
jgi:hypothetical protein